MDERFTWEDDSGLEFKYPKVNAAESHGAKPWVPGKATKEENPGDDAETEVSKHKAHADAIYQEVFKAARMAGMGLSASMEEGETAKRRVCAQYIDQLRSEIMVQKAKLSKLIQEREAIQ